MISTDKTETISLIYCYWSIDGNELKISQDQMIEFLISKGYFQLPLDGLKLNTKLCQLENNVVTEVNDALIRNRVTNDYLDLLPEILSINLTKRTLRAKLRSGINSYLDKNKLNCLPIIRQNFIQDTDSAAYFFFKNGIVMVTKEGITLKPYVEMNGCIWRSQKIDFEFQIENDTVKIDEFMITKFLENISKEKKDINRHTALICVIGYLLHNFKNTSNKFAVIFSEANLTGDSEGGTGKGLFMQMIGKLRKVLVIEGKNINFDSQFAFQNVELDTQIIFFDDVKQSFNFSRLFSIITEGMSFERKYEKRVILPPEQSPKIVISSNYPIPGHSESDRRRRYEMELLPHYNSKWKPENEFHKMFFDDWTPDEWNLFYNLMLKCVLIYFMMDCKIPEINSLTINKRKLIHSTSPEFVEYMDDETLVPREQQIPCDDFANGYYHFANHSEYDKHKPDKNLLGRWVSIYFKITNQKFSGSKAERITNTDPFAAKGTRTVKCYTFPKSRSDDG